MRSFGIQTREQMVHVSEIVLKKNKDKVVYKNVRKTEECSTMLIHWHHHRAIEARPPQSWRSYQAEIRTALWVGAPLLVEDRSYCQSQVCNSTLSAAYVIWSSLLPHLFKMLPTGGTQKEQRQSTEHHREGQREHTRRMQQAGGECSVGKVLLHINEDLSLILSNQVKIRV